jgi:DNA polymerase-1
VLYEEAKRIAINTVAQGTAAEIMKQGMIQLEAAIKEKFPKSQMLLQIHDELLITSPEADIESVSHHTRQILERVVDWNVPLVVSMRSGSNWAKVSK